jgi:hypothetical protein
MKTNGDSARYSQDDSGQWWYRFGVKKPVRTRVFPHPCRGCGEEYLPTPLMGKSKLGHYCSKSCSTRASWQREESKQGRGEKSPRWKGGKTIRRGYVHVLSPDHPATQGNTRKYVLEHRLVMEEMLGRYLTSNETVHHINGITHDNRPENLELWQKVQPYGVRFMERKHCDTCTCFS